MVGRISRGALMQELPQANPWWRTPRWAKDDPHLSEVATAPFTWAPTVLDDVAPPNLYALRGPRRVGKSTVVKQAIARLLQQGVDPRRVFYFAADALGTYRDVINLFQTAATLFPDTADQPRFFFVDEISSVPEWQRGLKWLRDNTTNRRDCIVVTGSSARDVASGTTFLAGRRGEDTALDRLLLPMAFPDFARCAGFDLPAPPRLPVDAFFRADGRDACHDALVHLGPLVAAYEAYLLVGGFPRAVVDHRRSARVSDRFAADLWDVLRADLVTAGSRRPEHALRLLERLVAGMTSLVNMSNVAEALGVTQPTVAAWIDELVDAYTLFILFQASAGAPDLRKQRKVYPIDPLVAWLPSRLSAAVAAPDLSQLSEAVLAGALLRAVEGPATGTFGRPHRMFVYRSPSGGEVDFHLTPAGHALESKYIDTASTGDARALLANFRGGLLLTRSAVELQAGFTVLPASVFAWLLDQPA